MNPWYKRYVGDYLRDTAHLSLAEDGAYGCLLDHYYAASAPLPPDIAALYRICRAMDELERRAVDSVVGQFFQLGADGYHNKRADKEIAERAEDHERRSLGGHKTAEKRWKNHSSATSSRVGNPDTRYQIPEEEKHSAPSAPPASAVPTSSPLEQQTQEAAFKVFWEKWPRKQAKGAAQKAWGKVPMAEYPPVMAGLEKWLKSDQWARGVIPHPATWLNENRWQDEDIPEFGGSDGKPKIDPDERTRDNLRKAGIIN